MEQFKNMKIETLSQHNAEAIANDWHYEGVYSFYDMTEDPEDFEEIISPGLRGGRYFQVVNDDELTGYFCIEPLSARKAEIGLGLKPDLTGQGLGLSFLKLIEHFVLQHQKYQTLVLSVVAFNERAIKVYIKAGYVKVGTEMVASNNSEYEFILMEKNVSRQVDEMNH